MAKTDNVMPSPGEGGRDGVVKTDNVHPSPGEGPREAGADTPPPAPPAKDAKD